ncbi:EAL domain-containing protein [Massilia litorea]|uniref:EAL domain-containing protein n=1 Tax=Massilia litorea TaxID=2769491 RepID=A0A7L9U5Q8_9BURK|nr:EAL domain-containing protein [Massilia litorea]
MNDKTTTADLARLAEENTALIENSLDLIALIDAEGRFLRVNAATFDILGYRPEELVGRRYAELLGAEERGLFETLRLDLRAGMSIRHDLQSRWVRKDGRVIMMSVSVRWCAFSQVTYATGRDVTEQHAARQALDKSRQLQQVMLESIGDAFFAVDRDWRITYANRKAGAFVDVDVDASIGKDLLAVAPDLRDSPSLGYYQRAMETGEACTFETFWEPSGVWIEVRAYPSEDGLSVYFHDISFKHHAEQALKKSEQRYRNLFQQAADSIVIADRDLFIVAANGRACSVFGYTEEEFLRLRVPDIDSGYTYTDSLALALEEGQTQLLRITKRRKDGSTFPADVHISRFEDGGAEYYQAIIRDVTEREETQNRLRELATHDTLTGLPNRALLNERVQRLLDTCPRESTVAAMFFDLDRFKEINDSFGHEFGDVLLCEVAARLRRVIRPGDVIARLGGDEFVIAAHCSSGQGAAARIAEKLLDVLTAPITIAGQDVIIGASIGISLYPFDGLSKEQLFQAADTAMYRAKAAGRNRYRFFEPEMAFATRERMALETSLRPALARGEFELHYQPRIDLRSMQMVGMEALIRWNHPGRGLVSPAQFIPIAEETGLIAPIGRWVLHEACMQTMRLMTEFKREIRVSVNVSARQLAHATFVGEVRQTLQESGIPPHCLELELTESALIADIERTALMLRELHELGVKLAVDDFGTGYSGLAYLRSFPIDVLKLDRSFVLQDDERISAFDFVKAFVDMAHALKLAVVAEGVETDDVVEFLRAADCDEAQGYHFARPLPLAALRERLSAG